MSKNKLVLLITLVLTLLFLLAFKSNVLIAQSKTQSVVIVPVPFVVVAEAPNPVSRAQDSLNKLSPTPIENLQVVSYQKNMTAEEILLDLERRNLRPATLQELLQFKMRFWHELGQKDPPGSPLIMALSSFYQYQTLRMAPVVDNTMGLYVHWMVIPGPNRPEGELIRFGFLVAPKE